ncbi:uncharacterized protein LOC102706979 [Oryza brachyantha]|uniref:uncharacterized protein LOC102706979 n=1 Tax=Oryza brachyantha TaxID=4533 RepID=UPI001ADC2692|nr:uncharacterized protein LOC102706979 [Oryza brachyantha]
MRPRWGEVTTAAERPRRGELGVAARPRREELVLLLCSFMCSFFVWILQVDTVAVCIVENEVCLAGVRHIWQGNSFTAWEKRWVTKVMLIVAEHDDKLVAGALNRIGGDTLFVAYGDVCQMLISPTCILKLAIIRQFKQLWN